MGGGKGSQGANVWIWVKAVGTLRLGVMEKTKG